MAYQIGSKNYIDERQIKCCDTTPGTIEAGISLDYDHANQVHLLRFHFLENTQGIVNQTTKSMWLNKENVQELIKELKKLKFKKAKTKK